MNSFLEKSSNLNDQFNNLLESIPLSKNDLYEHCKISGNKKLTSLKIEEISKILDHLNIDLRVLEKGRICVKTVIAQLNGLDGYLRDSFIGNQGTRLKTIVSALSILSPERRAQVLKKYQLKEECFLDSKRLVSVELLKEIFNEVSVYSYSEDLNIIGQINCSNFLDNDLSKELESFKTPVEAYAYFIKYCTESVEKNMDYSILKIEPNRLVFEYKTKESLQDFSKVKHFGNINFCQNIKGFCEELLKYRYRYPATVNKLSCAHLGCGSCTYEIIFDNIVAH